MKLEPGMVFVVSSTSLMAKMINFVQKAKAIDNESVYNHAGIIIDEVGTTFEALSQIRSGFLYGYRGCQLLVVRHKQMTEELFRHAFSDIICLDRCMYPVLRLALHLIGLAKYIHWKYPVCSELVGKFEFEAGLRKQWWGINPDNLADEWRISKYYDVIYEGVL